MRLVAGSALLTLVALTGAVVIGQSADATTYTMLSGANQKLARLDVDNKPVELGVRFSVERAGSIDAIRFLKALGDINSRTASLWTADGKLIASAVSQNETRAGWQRVALPQPVVLQPSQIYVVSYTAHRYVATQNYFQRTVKVGPITAPGGQNGVYSYSGGFPTKSWKSSNYWVDVEFRTGGSPAPTSTPTSTSTSTPTVTATAGPTTTATSPTATTSAPTGGGTGLLSLPRVPWDGGPAFYAKFPAAKASGWSSPDFFPISVFLGKPGHAQHLAGLGINTYMGAEHDGSSISTITKNGISVLAQDEWSTAEIGKDQGVVGWLVSDECDMGLGCTGDDAAANLAAQKKMVTAARNRNDGRFTQANYGNGVLGTWWAQGTMDDLVQVVDVSSVDKYAYTSPHVQGIIPDSPYWPKGATVASSGAYGWLQDRMRSYLDAKALHPTWTFVETGRPFLNESGSKVITPDQIEGAVWSSLIHEARGIAYFQHSNDPTCATYSLVDCDQARQQKVKQIDAQVRSLAPVLNTQSYVWDFKAGADTMLKAYGKDAYVFAGIGLKQAAGSKTFTLPAGVTGKTVTVVDENRTVPVVNGTFTDSFAGENTHHIYKVAL